MPQPNKKVLQTLNMTKITKPEFEKWSEFYLDYYQGISAAPEFQNLPASEKEKSNKAAATIYTQIKLGNTLTILFFVDNLTNQAKLLPANIRNQPSQEWDNLTLEEYLNNIKKRVKEHHISRGYCKPNNRLSRASLNEKFKNVETSGGSDTKHRDKLLGQMNEEDLNFVWNFLRFVLLIKELYPNTDFSQQKEFSEEEYQSEYGIIVEDLVKTIETAEQKIATKKPSSASSPMQNLATEEKEKIVKKLVADKTQLKNQKSKIEKRSSSNDHEKEIRDQLLEENAREIAERDREIARLLAEKSKPEKSENKSNNSTGLNWAIGLGIAAVVIGLFCLILLLQKKKTINYSSLNNSYRLHPKKGNIIPDC